MPWKPPIHQPVNRHMVRKASARLVVSRSKRGYTREWDRCSKAYLQSNPLCVHCMRTGVRTAATITDHITPHKGDMSLFWDESNWQSLCKRCHDVKTASEDGGFGNKKRDDLTTDE